MPSQWHIIGLIWVSAFALGAVGNSGYLSPWPRCPASEGPPYVDIVGAAEAEVAALLLGCAARHNAVDALSMLLGAPGVNVDAAGLSGWHASHEAAMAGHVAALDVLIRFGASLDAREDDGRTPLHWAALAGHVSTVALLLRARAEPAWRDGALETPLHSSAIHGHVELAELLLDNGAEVNAQDAWAQTPLHGAVLEFATRSNGHAALVELLLAHGAAADAPDVEGRTPLHKAYATAQAGTPHGEEVLGLLLRFGQ